jgi:multiple sugar transport system permease protein
VFDCALRLRLHWGCQLFLAARWNSTATSASTGQPLYPLVITGALFSIAPLIALFLYLRRYIISGLMLGSWK